MRYSWKDNVIRQFDAGCASYDRECDVQRTIAGRLSADLPPTGIYDILEIGCGTGNLTGHLLQNYPDARLCITDISPAMLTACQEKYKMANAHWKMMDGEKPDNDKTYDLIVANMTFQWFEDCDAAIARLYERLKPSGYVYYTMPGPESFREWRSVLNTLNLPVGLLDFTLSGHIYRQEEIRKNYTDAATFLRTIKKAGAGTARQGHTPLSIGQMRQACTAFDRDYNGQVTWHILYGCIRKEAQT